jgi:hypothetical protein
MKRALLHLAGLCLAAGCAVGPGSFEELPEGELFTTETCEALLDHGALPLAVGSIQGTSRYVLDTNQGRCVEERDELIDTLRRHDHGAIVAELSRSTDNPAAADPNPHPDRPDAISGGPSVAADPNPHPDTNADVDSADDEEAAVVVVWVVVVEDDDMAGDSHHGK